MSRLRTVVGSDEQFLADWNLHKAPPGSPLTAFHTKFWGKPEVRWRNNMEVDDSTADGHDIGSRCYTLDIGIQGVERGKIWVRADYIRIFEFAEKFYAESLSDPLSPCLVITGQRGIG